MAVAAVVSDILAASMGEAYKVRNLEAMKSAELRCAFELAARDGSG